MHSGLILYSFVAVALPRGGYRGIASVHFHLPRVAPLRNLLQVDSWLSNAMHLHSPLLYPILSPILEQHPISPGTPSAAALFGYYEQVPF